MLNNVKQCWLISTQLAGQKKLNANSFITTNKKSFLKNKWENLSSVFDLYCFN